MPRLKLFPDSQQKELTITMPADKIDALRKIARSNGLALTDYVRSMCFSHLARITQADTESKR